MECRKETEYALRKTPVTKTIREKEYQFFITAAYCKECGCEVGVKGILEYNAGEIDEQFRKAEDIVTTEEIEKLGKIYSLGKAPLSIALGFGEVTITRYLAGQIPSKEYSDIMRAALSDTKVMKEMLESNKDKLADAAYKKAISAIAELDALFSVPSKMLMVISYIFGKDIDLLERFGNRERIVALYIKFNKISDQDLFIISFHEQEHPLSYYFI